MTMVKDIAWDHIPRTLSIIPRWVVWKYEDRDDTRTKPPYNARTGDLASTTDAATWSTFPEALTALRDGPYAGIGFVLTDDDDLFCIDLDHCIEPTTHAVALQTVQGPAKWLDKAVTVLPNQMARFKKVGDELAVVTQGQVDKARGILRDLVGGEIRLHGAVDGAERFLMAELAGDYAGLLRLVAGPRLNLVAVTRIERVTRGL